MYERSLLTTPYSLSQKLPVASLAVLAIYWVSDVTQCKQLENIATYEASIRNKLPSTVSGEGVAGIMPSKRLIRWSPNGNALLTDYGVTPLISTVSYPQNLLDHYLGRSRPADFYQQSIHGKENEIAKTGIKFSGADWENQGRSLLVSLGRWGLIDANKSVGQNLYRVYWSAKSPMGLAKIRYVSGSTINACPSVEPGGKRIAYLVRDGVAIFDTRSGISRVARFAKVTSFSPMWSPSGKQLLVFATQNQNNASQMFLIDVTTGAVRDIGLQTLTPNNCCWSADGKHIISSNRRLERFDLKGNLVAKLGSEPDDDSMSDVAASPNGNYVAYVRADRKAIPAYSVLLYDVRSRTTRVLVTLAQAKGRPEDLSWGPKSDSIAMWLTGGRESVGANQERTRLMVFRLKQHPSLVSL